MSQKDKQKSVPRSRLGRLGRVARMAGGVATGMVGEGVRQLSQGNRPKVSDLILTPNNAQRVAKQLSAMRGAAMKVGQLLSMEGNDLLPTELADILAQLRDSAYTMPREQLDDCLIEAYGDNWLDNFNNFDYNPLAAASIGQVHRARSLNDDEIVLKVQYPGVAQSIDSDVDNIATLLRISNLLPKHMEISDLLNDAKKQLHEEAEYRKEAKYLDEFYQQLKDDDAFIVPKHYPELSTDKVLAMDYLESDPIETVINLGKDQIDKVMHNLFRLMFTELFDLRLMQTDANFANYRFDNNTEQVVLLDFGATRRFTIKFVTDYKRIIRAVIAQDRAAIIAAADRLGYQASSASERYQEFLSEIFCIALEPFAFEGEYDFAAAKISERLSELSDQAYDFKEFWQTPPTDILYLHRKLGGMFMLATRLRARVNCHALLAPAIARLK